LPHLGGQGARLFYFKLSNGLWLAFVEDLKILLTEISDGISLSVADYCANHYQLYIYFEGRGFIVGGKFRGVWFLVGLRGRARSGG
jgi:hypothetical protein